MTGSMAVTRPPGLRCQPLTPSASTTRSTGRRFAATTRSNVGPATVMSHHLPARGSEPAYARARLGYVSARQRSNFAGILDESTRFLAATHVAGSLAIGFRRHEDGLQDRVDGSTKCEGSLGGGCSCAGPPDAGPQPSPAAATRASPRTTTTGQLACSTQW